MRSSPSALALAALVLVACHEPRAEGRPPPPPPPAGVSASLSVRDGDGAAGPFRLASLGRLAIDASYAGVERGPHPARLDVFTPRGSLYAQYQADLLVDAAGHVSWLNQLEVAGTPIETFHQAGTWRFVLTVDEGAPLATAEVSLVP